MDIIDIQAIVDTTMPDAIVDVPEWGGQVKVRAISAQQAERISRHATNPKTGAYNAIQATCMIAEAGMVEPKLAPGQWKMLMQKPIGPIKRIAERINELSGILGDEETIVYCPECGHKFLIDEAGNPLGEA